MPNTVDAYPLSHMQEGMLFHSLYAPNSGVYIEQMVISLHENLNIVAFQQAWQTVVDRHPVLRTSFSLDGPEGPLQRVHSPIQVAFATQDYRGLEVQEQRNRLETYLEADR